MTLNSMEEEGKSLEDRLKSNPDNYRDERSKSKEENKSEIEHQTSEIITKSDPDSYRDRNKNTANCQLKTAN